MIDENQNSGFFHRILSSLTAKLLRTDHQRFYEFAGIIKNCQIPNTNLFSNVEIKEYATKPLDRSSKTTLLHKAAEMDNSKVLEFLLEHADNVEIEDKDETTPLMIALQRLDMDKIKLLVEKGASLNRVDVEGYSAICEVVSNDNVDILKYALDHGLNPNLCCNEIDHQTLLHLACFYGSLKQVCLLLEHNASVSVVDAYGQSPIHLGASGDYADVVEYLIAHGDDMNHPAMNQMTPLNYAKLTKAEKTEELLTKMNASCRDDVWLEDVQPAYDDWFTDQFDDVTEPPASQQ